MLQEFFVRFYFLVKITRGKVNINFTGDKGFEILLELIFVVGLCWLTECLTGTFSFIFWASSSNHFLAALDLGADVEQPFDCLIVQNHQAMQSMGMPMDWTLKDNTVDGLFFCNTLTGRRGGQTPFVQAGAETSRRIIRTHAVLGRVIPVPPCRCREWKCGVL